MKAVNFYNFSDEDFSYTWDRDVFDFPAGETVKLQEYLAKHFAKHLVDRELNKAKLATNHFSRESLIAKALPGYGEEEKPVTKSEAKIVAELLNAEPEVKEVKAKRKKKEEEPKEEEFADLAQ